MPCSYSLAYLAVPYGGRQDARLEPKYILNNLSWLVCGELCPLRTFKTSLPVTRVRYVEVLAATGSSKIDHNWVVLVLGL
jgi:hypothetical protein